MGPECIIGVWQKRVVAEILEGERPKYRADKAKHDAEMPSAIVIAIVIMSTFAHPPNPTAQSCRGRSIGSKTELWGCATTNWRRSDSARSACD